jgi:hypothetical protein
MDLSRWISKIAVLATVILAVSSVDATSVAAKRNDDARLREPLVSLYGRTPLTGAQIRQAQRTAALLGLQAFVIRAPMLAMVSYKQNDWEVLDIPRGWRVPMAAVAMPIALVRSIATEHVAEVLDRGDVVLGHTSATLRKASVGDVITVLDRRNRRQSIVVGAIVPDVFTADADILMSDIVAQQLGVTSIQRVVFTGVRRMGALRRNLNSQGFRVGSLHRLVHSSDQKNPDAMLGLAKVKELLGEFSYKPVNKNGVLVETKWRARNIAYQMKYNDVGLIHNCHRVVIDAVQAALTEIRIRGLSGEIDVAMSNQYGGCYRGRYSRQAEKVFGNISRHAWGMAFDVNTSTNARGAVPQLNCDVVRIFRKHGFAWGGNFIVPDGMHFEYVGEPRDQLKYRSTYCPNT